ncbi:PilZ domain protein [Geotalea daltonii FRC-32]|uniref:PilZ domain protein n=1 Tax=Geotalea daltonii (strain DSM 22248 / JCM 15807 / FRC-32) TaxID=316067 RepID=B9M4A1_GEODF|nr:PilZ domain-containing protein [Geotalea daltonii]ACM21556.1 PilZ domain protein [Geotalea daltonii FRC-32]
MEKRKFARLAMHSDTNIKFNNTMYSGTVRDLSMKGAFVTTDVLIPVNETVEVTIYTSSTPNMLCDLQAKVIRSTEYGIGLEFEKTVLD